MMFQNPLRLFLQGMNLEAFLLEPYINYGLMDVTAAKDDIRKWIQHVDLPETIVNKYPQWGQRRSIATRCISTNYADES